jgi:hypothetical protein
MSHDLVHLIPNLTKTPKIQYNLIPNLPHVSAQANTCLDQAGGITLNV